MSRVLTYNEIDQEQWNALVRDSATGTWFQTPEAYAFFASMPDLFRPFVVAVERISGLEVSGLAGVCVGYVTKEKNAVKQFFTRRAIIIGGPALADDATEEEVIALMTAIREQPILNPSLKGRTSNHPSLQGRDGKRLLSPIYIETRNLNDYSRWKEAFEKAGFDYMPHLNFHIDPRVDNLSSNRKRQIRHAKGLVVSGLAVSEEEIREWYEILRELYRTKVKTPLWPEEFFLEAYRQGVGTFMMVKHNNRVIGGSMLVMGKEGTTYEWYACGQNRVYKDQHPSVMATWAGIQWAKEQGYTRYDMMGAGKPDEEYGVRDFKAEFGGEKVEHGRFVCVQRPLLYRLGTWAVSLMKG